MSSANPIKRHVVCAAIRHRISGAIICGPRHFDKVMREQIDSRGGNEEWRWSNVEQGFIDQRCEFMTRTEAREVAVESGQIVNRFDGDKVELYSENLY